MVDKQSIILPGYDGGAEWGGPAVDPATGVIYINANDVAWTGALTLNKRSSSAGESTYISQCSACHGDARLGAPPAFPSLVDVTRRLSDEQIVATIHGGKGRMPAFPGISQEHLAALIAFLHTAPEPPGSAAKETVSKPDAVAEAEAYRFTGYKKFLDPDGYPAIVPPWGTLNAIDLNTGKYLWKMPLGQYPELVAKGMKDTGSENYGGPIVTAGGVVIIGATIYDRKIRAFDSHDGKLLWEAELPFSGVATPATYMVGGKQYIVIATSGGRNAKGPQGAAYVAFALP
jgi:quinoprotein glucose dehydrogenase